jgi:hypothetical protein
MTTVPYTFGNESSPIPLSQLDANFAVVPNYANSAGNVTNGSQPAITSVGTLTSLSVIGNAVAGNVSTAGQVSAVGNVYSGNVLTGGVISAYGSITGGSISVAADAHVAGVLSAIGSVTASNFNTSGQVSAVGNVVGGNVNTVGRVNAQGNILAQGIISATGNIITASNFIGTFFGNLTGNISGLSSAKTTQVLFNSAGNVDSAGGLTYNSGSNVLSVLGTVSAQANVIADNIFLSGSASITGNLIADNAQFTGLVTAPTPTATTANNQIATTAFVNNKVGTLGTMSTQNANSVSIIGGTLSNGIINLATVSNSNISNSNIANVNVDNAIISNLTISSLTNPLTVSNGGTGLASATTYGLLVGNGVSSFSTISPGTSGNILTSNGTNWDSISAPAIIGLGFGGTSWQNMGDSRSPGVTYTNTAGYPIQILITLVNTNGSWLYINGSLVIRQFYDVNTGAGQHGFSYITAIIPNGSTYLATSGGLYTWWELR